MEQSLTTASGRTTTSTRLKNPQFLMFFRVIWLVMIIFCAGFFIYSIPSYFVEWRDSALYGGGYATVLDSIGLSRGVFAGYFVAIDIALALFSLLVATFLFRMRSDDWLALLVSGSIVLIGVSASPAISVNSLWVASALAAIGSYALLLTFMVFPDGRFVPAWMKWLAILDIPFAIAIFFVRSMSLSASEIPPLIVLAGIINISIFVIAFLNQIYRYRNVATQLQRQQVKWVILVFAIIIVMVITYMTIPVIIPDMAYPGVLYPVSWAVYTPASLIWMMISVPTIIIILGLFPISILFGILRYRLWDVDVVINRSLVYGAVALLTVAIFFLASLLIQVIFGDQQIWIALVFSLIVSAAIFNPVRNRVQSLVDRYIYGLRFDLNELNRAQRAVTITNPGKLTGEQFGDYEVRGVLGKGGMGEVYEGYGNGKRVAIKTMLPDVARDPDLKLRFEREVEIGLSLKNRHIAEVYASGTHDGTPYLIMEFIDGEDLGDVIKARGKIDDETAKRIIQDVCAALSVAHEQGYVHRDIKPSNIMLRENGEAVLMDFGISKITDAKTITGTGAVGTIQYMAPEQIVSSKDVDHRVDIYALGCVLYQMLTGETPFTGGAAQVMFAQIQQPAPDPRDSVNVQETLANAILKALEKDPDERFSSAAEFSATLQD